MQQKQQDGSDELVFESPVDFREPPTGTNMARELVNAFRRHSDRTIMVDAGSNRQWTGRRLLEHCGRIAASLVKRAGVKVNDVVMTMCDRNDSEVTIAIGIVLSGASLYPTMPADGYNEAHILCELVQPQVLVINRRYHEIAARLCRQVAGMSGTKIVWIDSLSNEYRPNGVANGQHQLQNGQTIKDAAQQRQKQIYDKNNNDSDRHNNYHDHDQNNNNSDGEKTITRNGCNGCEHKKGANTRISSQFESIPEMKRKQRSHIEAGKDKSPTLIISLDEIDQTEQFDEHLVNSIATKQIDNQRHTVYYLLTSGSTGRPKVVPSSHIESACGLYSMISAATNPFRRKSNSDENNNNADDEPEYLLPLSEADVVAGDLPLDHGAGLNIMFLALWFGAKYIVMPSFEPDFFWRAVNDHRISFSLSSTSFTFQLLSHIKRMTNERKLHALDLSSMSTIICCGAKMTFFDLAQEIRVHFPHMLITQGYGCTENGYIANPLKQEAALGRRVDSVGHLFPGIKAKIVDASGNTCKPGQRGELLIWSRSLFKRYQCHPEVDANAVYRNSFDDQGLFYRTGDQVHVDHEGRLYIHGRFKDTLVLMGDWKIMPAELEQVVNEHPLVEAAAVVGVPDPELPGCHKPRAFVILVKDYEVEGQSSIEPQLVAKWKSGELDFVAEHIYKFAADRTAPAKHLTGGVRILDEFPRVGLIKKIDRNALRQMD